MTAAALDPALDSGLVPGLVPGLDPGLALEAVRVCEAAAIACAAWVGRGDEMAADLAAVEGMRAALDAISMDGRIVIGEGERDETDSLYVGEAIGRGGAAVDIAVDPLEGVTLAAKAMPNALAVVAFAPRGGLLHTPGGYMDKIAVGPGYPPGVVDLDTSPADNVRALAAAKGVEPSAITVCVLDRPRHAEIIAAVRQVGARVHLIADGDIAGVIYTTDPLTGIDLYLGSGGAPEGVLACAALKCVGGQFQGRLLFRGEDEKARARRFGLAEADFGRKYVLDELVGGPAVFAATGVTSGALLRGVSVREGRLATHTLVMDSASGESREIRTTRRA